MPGTDAEPESLTMDLPESVDEPALRRVKTVARVMDEAVRIPGTNTWVGLDPVLGVVPGAGDAVAAGVSLYVVAEAAYLGVPLTTVVRMLANVAADAALGSVPVVGPLFDAVIKANTWNVSYLEEFVANESTDRSGDSGREDDRDPVTIEVTEG
ncbi:DUF4112 domain-containing protein [Halobaculum sp. CBA1158]|uniref:DUF4112 domain-containing protein n=1 Tax=Halobaculum sp. CBA1158 TaxID=2904243 RepID=UPI001F3310F1|nr:DUF4112 domain-containing protein [Halobaculum sp. CBA1158]UIO99280.1 DUF4112 domain-containing protein [Halobaculum sp. CBA1158]